MENLCIWWLSGVACRMIGEHGLDDRTDVPGYIKAEFNDRVARAGRGRLWVSPELDEAPSDIPWDDDKRMCQTISSESMGGIVIRRTDIPCLPKNVGLITDFNFDSI